MDEKAAAQRLREESDLDIAGVFAFGDSGQMADDLLDLVELA